MAIFYTDTASLSILQVSGSAIISGSTNPLTIIGSGSNILTVSGSLGGILQVSETTGTSDIFVLSSGSIDVFKVDAFKNVFISGSLTVTGSIKASLYSVVKPTTTYNATQTSGQIVVLGDTTAGAFSINLPTAVNNTAVYNVKKIAGTPALTIDANASETIDGGGTAVINVVSAAITLVSDNTNWHII
jgi:hypothetical protein